MISVSEALTRVLDLVTPLDPEPVALAEAAGRVLAEDAIATRAQPPFAASAMDGYAVAGEIRPGQVLRVIGQSRAGEAFLGTIGAGEALRIFTGAPVPSGATRVVLQEDVEAEADRITIGTKVEGRDNIRPAGADFGPGQRLIAPRRLRAADLALLAAMNVARPKVSRRPEIAIIATGDELVMPGEQPSADQIVASNLFAIKALAEAEGARVRLMPIARDTEEALSDVLDLAHGADVIVTIGGASVGEHDLVARVAEAKGMTRAFHRIALRPGKPLMSGTLGKAAFLGLPGNPVSAIVCAQLFLLPMLRKLQGLTEVAPKTLRAHLAHDLEPNGNRSHYMRARLIPSETGLPAISAKPDQDSAMLVTLTESDALLVRGANDGERARGEVVDYIPL